MKKKFAFLLAVLLFLLNVSTVSHAETSKYYYENRYYMTGAVHVSVDIMSEAYLKVNMVQGTNDRYYYNMKVPAPLKPNGYYRAYVDMDFYYEENENNPNLTLSMMRKDGTLIGEEDQIYQWEDGGWYKNFLIHNPTDEVVYIIVSSFGVIGTTPKPVNHIVLKQEESDTSYSYVYQDVSIINREYSLCDKDYTLVTSVEYPLTEDDIISIFKAYDEMHDVSGRMYLSQNEYENKPGNYPVTICVSDEYDNLTSYSFYIKVFDQILPTISGLEQITFNQTEWQSHNLKDILSLYSASYGDIKSTVYATNEKEFYNFMGTSGTFTLHLESAFKNYGLMASKDVVINVIDDISPSLYVSPSFVVETSTVETLTTDQILSLITNFLSERIDLNNDPNVVLLSNSYVGNESNEGDYLVTYQFDYDGQSFVKSMILKVRDENDDNSKKESFKSYYYLLFIPLGILIISLAYIFAKRKKKIKIA